ncbi:O-antigen polysaccharide polymerase Wzy family protein [Paenibacillus sp. Soil522]|uniref:O-antigen polysaccharide polymerase Wzy family protein n=1 Tax=Paenibacillus sp. Soil522 TaxID=1736388 RepID=UPI0006F80ECA|nr:O-antigen polysaccharide polymerase Wzy family protein [Paenibacillus sp. Soil522]KRE47898.1 hypothetical protein ASG81_08270 [Paenibacillus sp. Soil522]
MFILFSWISLATSIILWAVSAAFTDNLFLFFAFHIMWISNLLYALSSVRKRFIFGVFNLTFFIFVMGRMTMSYIFYGNFGLEYSSDVINNVFSIIMVALVSLRAFYAVFKNRYIVIEKQRTSAITNNIRINGELLRKACIYLYWITLAFSIVNVMEKVLFVQTTSYADYYTSFSTSLPSIFAKLDSMNEIFFFIYLATNPRKKEMLIASISFLALGALSLGYGQRNPIALRFCILLLTYIPLRELFRKKDEEKWITKKYKFGLTLALPAAIVFFSFWGSFRLATDQSFKIADAFINFFDSQGNSARILAETIVNWSIFPTNRVYTVGPLVDFLTNNFIYKLIFNSSSYYSGFTVEGALNGWNFGNAISYFYDPFRYLQGVGLGSTYLAETYKDFGYIGVVIISGVYVWIMCYATKNYGKNFFVSGVVLIFLYKIIYAPRDLALSFLGKIFSFTFILAIALIFIIYKFLHLSKIRKESITGDDREKGINESN